MWSCSEFAGYSWRRRDCFATTDEPRCAVPGARDKPTGRPRWRARHPGPEHPARRRVRVRGHEGTAPRAAAAPAAVRLEAGRGAAGPGLPVLDRRSRFRPRFPRTRAGAAGAWEPGTAVGSGGANLLAAAGPRAAVVGAVRDPGPRARPDRGPHED